VGEWLRRVMDLEHWAAFRASFDQMVDLLTDVVGGADPPASVLILSGDVHCSYTARAQLPFPHPETVVHQLTQSPFRNPMETTLKLAYTAVERPVLRRLWHRLARGAGVRDVRISWDLDHGPWFVNGVMTLVVSGREARVEVGEAGVQDGRAWLDRTRTIELTARQRQTAGR
jgi:hypothetical protein